MASPPGNTPGDPMGHTFTREREEMARHTIPQLIELLESEDLRTRFLAEMVLRDATSI